MFQNIFTFAFCQKSIFNVLQVNLLQVENKESDKENNINSYIYFVE